MNKDIHQAVSHTKTNCFLGRSNRDKAVYLPEVVWVGNHWHAFTNSTLLFSNDIKNADELLKISQVLMQQSKILSTINLRAKYDFIWVEVENCLPNSTNNKICGFV